MDSPTDNNELKRQVALLSQFLSQKFGVKEIPKLIFSKSEENREKDPLGKTAFYDPTSKSITLYIDGRWIVDILRSYSHEYVHFWQDLNRKLKPTNNPYYAQEDDHMRRIEQQAYLLGNMYLRDFQDMMRKKSNNPI